MLLRNCLRAATRGLAMAIALCAPGVAAASAPALGAAEADERLARRGMVAALLGSGEAVRSAAIEAERLELREGSRPGISGELALLEAWLTEPAEARMSLLARIAARRDDPPVAARACHAMAEAPVRRIRRLRTVDRYNRFASLFNYVSRLSTSLVSGEVQSLVRLGVDALFLWEPFVELTPHNRRAIDVHNRWREEIQVDSPGQAEGLARYVDGLRRRRRLEGAREARARGEWHLEYGRWEEARWAFARASAVDPGDRAARRGRLEAARGVSAARRARLRSLEAGACPGVADPKAELDSQRARLRRDVWRYVLLGERTNSERLKVHTTMRGRVHRLLGSLSVLLPVEWIGRGLQCGFSAPVRDGAWRSAAARYLRHVGVASPEGRPVARLLAKAYEKRRLYDKARELHDEAFGGGEGYGERLDKKASRRALRLARAEAGPGRRLAALDAVAQRYGHTRWGEKAGRLAETLADDMPEAFAMAKDDLARWPRLWSGRGLQLDPAWLDGEAANGELADGGVRFLHPDGRTVAFAVDRPAGDEEHRVELDDRAWGEVRAVVEEWRREVAADESVERMMAGPVVPVRIEGSAGPGGVDVYPRLMPLSLDVETLVLYRPTIELRR